MSRNWSQGDLEFALGQADEYRHQPRSTAAVVER